MKVPFVAPATFSVCTLLSGCVEQTPAAANEPAGSSGPATVVNENVQHHSSTSDCFRDRLAEYRKMHGTNAPLRDERVADWLEYCQGT